MVIFLQKGDRGKICDAENEHADLLGRRLRTHDAHLFGRFYLSTMPKCVIFDLDGTLAESKQPLEAHMADLLAKLLAKTNVAVASGGALPQFLKQVVARMPQSAEMARLYLLPTSGAAMYAWRDGGWDKIYEERIPEQDAETIMKAVREAAEATGLVDFSEPSWGERIEYRGSEVTLSVLGQEAPVAEKKVWDPDKKKRRALREAIAGRLPKGYQAGMGGSTSIDVTRIGADKAYGIRQLARRLGIKEEEMLYVGDELIEGGNDEAALSTKAQIHPVKNPHDTEQLILTLLSK